MDVAAIESLDLGELLDDLGAGKSGSFGFRLQGFGVTPYLHAYAVSELALEDGATPTFDLHYFNVFFGANIADLVIAEIQLEHEHGGDEYQIRYAQTDVRIFDDLLVVRVGKFLVPVGLYNELLYPEYLSKLPDRPFALREILPVSWAEVGAQVRGSWEFLEGRHLSYALYAVNGLEQADDPLTPKVEDGGNIRGMRNNHIDENHWDKAIGGQLGIELTEGLQLGLAGYTGAYTVDGNQRLSIGVIDARYRFDDVVLEGAYTAAYQTRAGAEALVKHGGYALFAYRLFERLEPVFQIDGIYLPESDPDTRARATIGMNFVPFPHRVVNFLVKSSYGVTYVPATKEISNRFVVQAAVGF